MNAAIWARLTRASGENIVALVPEVTPISYSLPIAPWAEKVTLPVSEKIASSTFTSSIVSLGVRVPSISFPPSASRGLAQERIQMDGHVLAGHHAVRIEHAGGTRRHDLGGGDLVDGVLDTAGQSVDVAQPLVRGGSQLYDPPVRRRWLKNAAICKRVTVAFGE